MDEIDLTKKPYVVEKLTVDSDAKSRKIMIDIEMSVGPSSICKRITLKEEDFKNALVHLGWTPPPTEPIEIVCFYCGWHFTDKDALEIHLREIHPEKKKTPKRDITAGKFLDAANASDKCGDAYLVGDCKREDVIIRGDDCSTDSRRAHMAMRLRDQGFTVEQVLGLLGTWQESEDLKKADVNVGLDEKKEVRLTLNDIGIKIDADDWIENPIMTEKDAYRLLNRIHVKLDIIFKELLAKPSPVDKT